LNDPSTRALRRHLTVCSGLEHGFRGSAFRSRTLHAASDHDGVLANRLQGNTLIGLAHNGGLPPRAPSHPRLATFERATTLRPPPRGCFNAPIHPP
jgi:hypothetical protein